MDEFELCRNIRRLVLIRAAEVMSYRNWSDGFAAGKVRETVEWVRGMDGFRPLTLSGLTDEQMDDLGFGRWSEETPMRLIPLWLHPFLADEIEVGSVSGEEPQRVKREEIDNDHRFGCLAYGVFPAAARA